MAAPTITAVTPDDGFNAFPIGEKIEILFNQEISQFLAENSISLVGPDALVVTGQGFEEKIFCFTNGANFGSTLNSLSLQGEVPIDVEVIKCDSSGVPIDPQASYEYDAAAKSKLVIRPKLFLQEKTDYKLIISGSSAPAEQWSYLGSRSIYDPEKDPMSSGDGVLKASGYTSVEDVIVVTVVKAGSSTTCKLQWYLESLSGTVYDLFPLSGRNKITKDKDIYLELIGGASDSFKAGDLWTINLRPTEYLVDAYKLEFSTAANQVKSLPSTVSQSPIGLDAPTQAEIIASSENFHLVKIEPEYGASNISVNTRQIILTFNKNINPTSVTAESVKLFRNALDMNEDKVDVGYSWIVSGKKLILNIIRE